MTAWAEVEAEFANYPLAVHFGSPSGNAESMIDTLTGRWAIRVLGIVETGDDAINNFLSAMERLSRDVDDKTGGEMRRIVEMTRGVGRWR